MTTIQIERLTTGTLLYIKADTFTGFAEVFGVEFDGEGYEVTFCTNARAGWDALDTIYVEAGGSVEFGGTGEPVLRPEGQVTTEEWQAKRDLIGRDIDRSLGQINELQGHVCQPIDERPLVAAVADAIGVPALQAAE